MFCGLDLSADDGVEAGRFGLFVELDGAATELRSVRPMAGISISTAASMRSSTDMVLSRME